MRSMFAPLTPMSTPGLAVWITTVTRCGMADDLHLGDVGALALGELDDPAADVRDPRGASSRNRGDRRTSGTSSPCLSLSEARWDLLYFPHYASVFFPISSITQEMWHMRLRSMSARPRALNHTRLMRGPSSIRISLT